jgi:hypothetical protein
MAAQETEAPSGASCGTGTARRRVGSASTPARSGAPPASIDTVYWPAAGGAAGKVQAEKEPGDAKIETSEDALKAVKDSSNAFFVVAALSAAVAVFLGQYWNLLDVALMVICASFLRRLHSRAAAILLLLLALGEAGMTLANKLGAASSGGNNLILAVVVVAAAVRAIQATFELHRLAGDGPARA